MDQNQKMFGFPLSQAITFDNVLKNMALNLKINWDHSYHMTHQGPTLRSLLKLDIFVSSFFMLWVGNKKRHILCVHPLKEILSYETHHFAIRCN
jgi:hypothetical protein